MSKKYFLGNKVSRGSVSKNKIIIYNKVDKGKLFERIGRKVMGLKHFMCQDCQAAGFFCVSSEVIDNDAGLKGV